MELEFCVYCFLFHFKLFFLHFTKYQAMADWKYELILHYRQPEKHCYGVMAPMHVTSQGFALTSGSSQGAKCGPAKMIIPKGQGSFTGKKQIFRPLHMCWVHARCW